MKIAQVNLQKDFGGAERHVLLLARGLQARGHRVYLLCHPHGLLRRYAGVDGIPTIPVSARTQLDPLAAARLLARLRRLRPDVLHLHTPRDYVAGAIVARSLQPRAVVVTRHMLRPVKPIIHWVFGAAGAIICLTPALRDHLRQQCVATELELIYGAIDCSEFPDDEPGLTCALRADWGLDATTLGVGIVGRLVPGKGHDVFLAAARELRGSRTRFLIVGDGPRRSALERTAAGLGITEQTVFAGFRDDVPSVISALDVLVFASGSPEVLPLTVLEGLAAGRPIITTAPPGAEPIVEDGVTGLVVPPGDAGALAAAIRRLAGDPVLRRRLGEAAREVARQRFALPRMIEETEQVYRRLCFAQFQGRVVAARGGARTGSRL